MAVEAESEAGRPSLRRRLYLQFDPRARKEPGLSPVNTVLTVAVLAVVAAAILETEPTVYRAAPGVFKAAEYGFTTLFTIEYLTRLWIAGEDPRYRGLMGRVRYIFSIWALIDLAAILPALLTGSGVAGLALRALRMFRIARLARLGALSDAAEAMSSAIQDRKYELILTAALGLLLMLVSATLLYFVEGPSQPEDFGSIPRSLWWAVATLTTVGYGDAFPVTVAGKLLAAITAVAGIAFVAMPTGILAAAFSDALRTRKTTAPKRKV